ncbi:Stk1 family PASTA domain-containing Ser/Thr kinase [Kocuria sp. LUK]|uniref:Stk1 family PASTA domain-containing Ser/Thr kinase n=1 Tax=Kocuria sp. LUK TaxID=2897828 RepID=UPI001E5F49DE|nr:Stk1 family PASTA domain-containing Ser/Thr kinase [Kocuria sp. LUK]MCD1146068.1 Stk1 family PASTA domain-containing Ser/Thr kinase [Kocuria sp. LUK]
MPGRSTVPRLINDRYEVGEAIGRGGMATVHVGRDLRLGRRVAIKVLRPELAQDDSFHERFKREAQSVAALNHHSIVSVYDTGEIAASTEEGVDRPYIVMEYVPGRTLRELVHQDAVSPREAVDLVLGILDALEYSHRAGIVHRDIKPANVIVTPEGQVKVMDFGIARAVEDTAPALTQAQAVLGTAQYLSPEQARGASVDARSDLYSAACVLFELLTGRAPFVGETSVDVAAQHVRDTAPVPSQVDPRLGPRVDAFMARALAKDPAERFQDAGQMRRALRELRTAVPSDLEQTQPVAAVPVRDEDTKTLPPVLAAATAAGTAAPAGPVPPGPPGTGSGAVRRNRGGLRAALFTLLVLAVLAVAGVLALQWVQAGREGPALAVVPQVAGMDAAVAETAVRDAGLVPERDEVHSDDVSEGDVVATDPAADTQVEQGSTVVLEVSLGPAEVEVPGDLAGRSEEEVREVLEAAGLDPGPTRTVNSAWVPRGAVVTTDPASGTRVPSGSEVELVLSTGRVTVPDVVGMPRNEAVAALSADGVGLGAEVVVAERSDVPAGQVVEQSVAGGGSAPQGATITLTVAVAPPPEPSPEPTPEPTEEETPEPSPTAEEDGEEPTAEPSEERTGAPEEGGEDGGDRAAAAERAQERAAERAEAARERDEEARGRER